MLKVRKLTLKDKKRAIEITKDIWDGDDYIPRVFDKWVNDKDGEFIAAIDEKGKVIGFEKLTMVSKHDAWIEGLRKDLKSNVKGVGIFLTNYFLGKLSKNKNIRTIRFSTYIYNVESINLFQKIGFRIIEKRDHKSLFLPKLKFVPKYKGNRTEEFSDNEVVWNHFKKVRPAKYFKNGICVNWVVKPFTKEIIYEEFVKKDGCLVIKDKNGIQALCLYFLKDTDLFIGYFYSSSPNYALEILKKIKQIAYKNKKFEINSVIPKYDKKWHDNFKQFGFISWETENDFLLFDKPVRKNG
ncbi:MAG: GNAT family N-acetyltransferase [Candidatus Delongbacteria bacterium]|nr:GNAT family N-acetyltransferase [Candidatus Delongbacteria bacterium]